MRTVLVILASIAVFLVPGDACAQRTIPPLTQILAASEFLTDGDIPVDSSTTAGKTPIYVATNGSDSNTGLDINSPKLHLRSAIQYANQHPSTPYVIYLRGGIHYESGAFDYLEIERGDLYITAYPGESATIRPAFWPNNPQDWGQAHFFVSVGPYQNITISDITLQGWDEPFYVGSDFAEEPMRNLVIKNIHAHDFKPRFPEFGSVFLTTHYVSRDFFSGAEDFDPNAPGIKYSIEGLILSNILLEGVSMGINIGDERDANVKGLRLTQVEIRNDPQPGGETYEDGFAVVNSYRVLIDHCIVDNIRGDGIDCKAFDVSLVNTYVHASIRNGTKFWRNGELINTIVHDCSPVADSAVVVEAGYPFRMIHSVLIGNTPGYSGGYNWPNTSTTKVEIVNTVFADLSHKFYMGTGNLQSKHSCYYNMPSGIFDGQTSVETAAQLNGLPNCTGNISSDPLFVNPAGEDFSVQEGSPCLNAGTTDGVLLPSFDYYGNPRIMGAAPDIGPYEQGPYSPTGDEDNDGLLNSEEDLDMDGQLDSGETDPNDPDTDGDGFSDILEVLCGGDPRNPAVNPGTIRINFGPSGSSRPGGYSPDIGSEYGPRGYGWR